MAVRKLNISQQNDRIPLPVVPNCEVVSSYGSDEIRAKAEEIISCELRRNSPGETSNSGNDTIFVSLSKLLKQDSFRMTPLVYEIDF